AAVPTVSGRRYPSIGVRITGGEAGAERLLIASPIAEAPVVSLVGALPRPLVLIVEGFVPARGVFAFLHPFAVPVVVRDPPRLVVRLGRIVRVGRAIPNLRAGDLRAGRGGKRKSNDADH